MRLAMNFVLAGLMISASAQAGVFEDNSNAYRSGTALDLTTVNQDMELVGTCAGDRQSPAEITYYFTVQSNPVDTKVYINWDHYSLSSITQFCTPFKKDVERNTVVATCGDFDVLGRYRVEATSYARQLGENRIAIFSVGGNGAQEACVFTMKPGTVQRMQFPYCWHQEDCGGGSRFSCRRTDQQVPGRCRDQRL